MSSKSRLLEWAKKFDRGSTKNLDIHQKNRQIDLLCMCFVSYDLRNCPEVRRDVFRILYGYENVEDVVKELLEKYKNF